MTAKLAETGYDVLILQGEKIVGKLTGFMSRTHAIDLMARINASKLPTPHIGGEISMIVGSDIEDSAAWDWAEITVGDKSVCLVECEDGFESDVALAEAIVKQVKGE